MVRERGRIKSGYPRWAPDRHRRGPLYEKLCLGITIPDELIERLKGAEKKKEEGLKIAIETIQQLREIEGVAGVHIMAIAWEEMVPEIVERAGLYPRPKLA